MQTYKSDASEKYLEFLKMSSLMDRVQPANSDDVSFSRENM